MKVFKSKVGYGVLIPALLLMLGISLLPFFKEQYSSSHLMVSGITLTAMCFTLNLCFNTIYRIDREGTLFISCGLLYRRMIEIEKIHTVLPTRNPISSPAPSLDRLELRFGQLGSVLISPIEKEAFIQELKKFNPNLVTRIR